jgi:Domain of Unknown Function with PDB structure (DUF3857)/Transglutaminase-like superfamily
MKKIKTLVIAILTLIAAKTTAQDYKLSKVTLAELEEKEHPKDPTAVAAILFKTGEVRFEYSQDRGFEMLTKVKTKIKIYKKEGYDWANKAVRYYVGQSDSKESVFFDDAITYNLVAGKIEKTKLKSDGEFDEKVNRYWNRKKITMPNIKEGTIIEYEYTIKSPNYGSLPDWNFQTSIPVNYSEFKTFIPEYFVYNPFQKGAIIPKVNVDKSERRINYVIATRGSLGLSGKPLVSRQDSELSFTETKTTYQAENLPAMKDENFVNNIDNYTASISHELTMTRFPNRPFKSYSTNWEAVARTIYDNEDFGTELEKTGYFEEDLKAILNGKSGNDEKISAIFNFVKSKVKWNDYTGYSCNDGVKKAYKDGVGNVAEINLMLTAMLRFAGIEANPVLVSTRSNGVAFFPSHAAYNYVIAAIENNDGMILLDATDKYAVPNVLPTRDLNWFGRLIRKDKSSAEVDMMPKSVSRENANLSLNIGKDGKIDGKIRKQYSNHLALNFRTNHLSTNKDNYLENLENKSSNIEINEYVRENDFDLSKPITETFDFKSDKFLEIINDKMYLSPLLFLTTKENPFKQETREYPVDFGYPIENKYNININLPEGYAIETIPSPVNIAMPENVGAFKYIIAQTENNIQIAVTESIAAAIVPSDFYEVLKDFFKQMVEKENEKIVLKKI